MRKEHPRPQFVRKDWLNLNGVWTCEYSKNIKGFKKVLAQSTAVEDLFLYGSFINFKIYQPELNKYYFDEIKFVDSNTS